jgi:hypothetical protein
MGNRTPCRPFSEDSLLDNKNGPHQKGSHKTSARSFLAMRDHSDGLMIHKWGKMDLAPSSNDARKIGTPPKVVERLVQKFLV